MERKSIDDILWKAKTGRCINKAQIENAARELIESRLSDLANADLADDKENHEWGFQLKELMDRGVKFRKYSYIDMIRSVNEISDRDKDISADIFMFISFLGAVGHRIRIPWLELSAERVMCLTGYGDAWVDFFAYDAVLWEGMKKSVPTVKNVLQCAFELFRDSNEGIKADPMSEDAALFDKNTYRKPFCRDKMDYPVYDPDKDMKMQYFEYNARLASVWTYYLMVAVPEKIALSTQ